MDWFQIVIIFVVCFATYITFAHVSSHSGKGHLNTTSEPKYIKASDYYNKEDKIMHVQSIRKVIKTFTSQMNGRNFDMKENLSDTLDKIILCTKKQIAFCNKNIEQSRQEEADIDRLLKGNPGKPICLIFDSDNSGYLQKLNAQIIITSFNEIISLVKKVSVSKIISL